MMTVAGFVLLCCLHLEPSSQRPDPIQLASQGEWAEAERAFAALEKEQSLSPAHLDVAVEVSSQLNHWERVVELLSNFRSKHRLTPPQRIKLYEAYLKVGNKEAAEEELRALVRDQPHDENLIHLLAYLHLSQEKPPQAAAVYRDYLLRHPRATESLVNLALIEFKLELAEQAFGHLKRAFATDFQKANAYFYRQLVRNMPPEGLAELAEDTKQELALPRDGIAAHLHLAREFENLKRYESAISYYEKYLSQKRDDAEASLALAKLYFQVGNSERSEVLLAPLTEKPGKLGELSRLFAAELAVKSGNFERASHLLAQLAPDYHQLSTYQYLAARVAMNSGQDKKAEALLEQLSQSSPKMAEAYYHLAQIYLRSGRTENARKALEEFEKLKHKAIRE